MKKVLKPRAQSDKQGLQQVGRLETISSITNMANGVIRFFFACNLLTLTADEAPYLPYCLLKVCFYSLSYTERNN